jgi:hypothetical protein
VRDDAMLARIKAIIVENARLLGEKPELGVRVRHDGVRIQVLKNRQWVRGQYKHYPSMESAYEAALVSNRRAHNVAAGSVR